MVIAEHGIQTFKVVVVVLLLLMSSFDVLIPTSTYPSFTQVVCPNILKCQFWNFDIFCPIGQPQRNQTK
jgi:hypothetical protein